jgi:hypothetical protein
MDNGFAAKINGPTAGDFFGASVVHRLEASPEAEKKSTIISFVTLHNFIHIYENVAKQYRI